MPVPAARTPRNLSESTRRRLEVATAMAWEALVDAHTIQALEFVDLLNERIGFEEALVRYLREMDLTEAIASAIRTRVLVALEDRNRAEPPRLQLHQEPAEDAPAESEEGWRRWRPDVVMRGVRERQKRQEETDQWIELSLARSEEIVIHTHIDNAITFAALLDGEVTLGRAVQAYLGAVQLTGGRAQSVFQRTMARLAEVHLPRNIETTARANPE